MVSERGLEEGRRRISIPGFSRPGPLIITRKEGSLSIWVYSTTDQKYSFDVGQDGASVFPETMKQQGETYQSFELLDFIKAIIEKLGYEVREQ
jgi:hypothetical protein